jgi:hypothetical protein
MSPQATATLTRRRRRSRAHACPECRSSWAVRGSRHPSGAWLLLCSVCDWRRVVPPSPRQSLDDAPTS